MNKILAINLGSTSTKLAIYYDEELMKETSIDHTVEELKPFKTINEQKDFRMRVILRWLEQEQEHIGTFDAIAPRGGNLKPISSGTYEVNQDMVDDLTSCRYGQHVCNLAGVLAYEMGSICQIPVYTTDPLVVDEMIPEARLAGNRLFQRKSIFHALNQKAMARRAAAQLGKTYEECNLVVAHMGGGITVGAHYLGNVIDVNNGVDGDGPFSPNRSGGLPTGELVSLCFSGQYSIDEVMLMLNGNGGVKSYIDEVDMRKVAERIKAGDKEAKLVQRAMAYQIAKEIGSCSVVSKHKLDGIVLTGGMAKNNDLVEAISEYVDSIAPILVFPGENEASSLAMGALRVLRGEIKAIQYSKEP